MIKVLGLFSLLTLVSCGDSVRQTPNHLVTPQSAATIMASAIRDMNKLDIAFYPVDLVPDNAYAYLDGNDDAEINTFSANFPDETKDQFLVGLMRGKDVREFLLKRTRGIFKKDIETAGLRYSIETKAGFITANYFDRDNGLIFDEKEYYRVAISNFFFFSGQTFPSYKFRDGANFSFIPTGKTVSAKESLRKYLKSTEFRALDLSIPNGSYVERNSDENVGFKKIYEIQGTAHRSPYWAKKVSTRGVVTAVNNVAWFPGGIDIILQDPEGDGNDKTSDGIGVYLDSEFSNIKIGDVVDVTGTVFEHTYVSGLSNTVIRNVESITSKTPESMTLPTPITLGIEGRSIPDKKLSSFVGNLNDRDELVLTDGIDFWESLEGMRVKIKDPRIVGFRGGKENLASEAERPRGYQTLYVLADGKVKNKDTTHNGGVLENFINRNFNPEIIQIADNHLSNGNVNSNATYNIGSIIEGEVTGVMSYQTNLFGDGEYAMVIPQAQAAFSRENLDRTLERRVTRTSARPKTALEGADNKLTVGSFNLKNLSGNQPIRMKQIGEVIRISMNCPDIVNLVEIQDNNGIALNGGADASLTLSRLIKASKCSSRDYRAVNIDPFMHSEGGQPGGNIRVAMIYDANRVDYTPWGKPSALDTTFITKEGNLSTNPGRVFALADAFKNTRKSTVAQFGFRGKKVVVVGNHFNSKLGDSALMGAIQPPTPESDERRLPIATEVNKFVREFESKDPNAHIIVAGDFNAEYNEASMVRLMGTELTNLMFEDKIVPADQRYTHNYNGSSAAIDFIFVNKNLMKLSPKMDVLHVNSDFMGRISDHDPLVAQFLFE